jgi:hypothetical protein
VPDLVDLGWTSLPDVAAKEWFPPIRLPRKPFCASRQPRAVDDATQSEMISMVHTRQVTSARQAPKDPLHDGRCGSTTELLGAEVDVRGHGRVSTAAARPACSPLHAGDPMPLAPSPDEPFEPVKLVSLLHLAAKAEATTNQHSTNRRPDNRSPTVHLA